MVAMTKVEVQHHSPEQVREILAEALRITADLEPATGLREVTYTKAVDLLAAKTVQLAPLASGAAVL